MPALAKTDAEHSSKPGLGLSQPDFHDQIFYKSAEQMAELPGDAVQLVVTSPPYFNIKDYSQNGHQDSRHSEQAENDIGEVEDAKRISLSCLPRGANASVFSGQTANCARISR